MTKVQTDRYLWTKTKLYEQQKHLWSTLSANPAPILLFFHPLLLICLPLSSSFLMAPSSHLPLPPPHSLQRLCSDSYVWVERGLLLICAEWEKAVLAHGEKREKKKQFSLHSGTDKWMDGGIAGWIDERTGMPSKNTQTVIFAGFFGWYLSPALLMSHAFWCQQMLRLLHCRWSDWKVPLLSVPHPECNLVTLIIMHTNLFPTHDHESPSPSSFLFSFLFGIFFFVAWIIHPYLTHTLYF